MKTVTSILAASALLLGSGCSLLMPKQVELFQDKVQQFPRPDDDFRQVQKQAAAELKSELNAIEKNLLAEGSSPDEVRPVSEAASLADALSTSLGPPLKPFNPLTSTKAWRGRPLQGLAADLDRETARFIDDVGDFAEKNDENAGKKIEGTGLIRIGYFSMLAVLFLFVFFGWVAVKVIGSMNQPVAIGSKVAAMPVRLAGKVMSQVIKGGEAFKNALDAKTSWSADEIKKLFRDNQEKAQDEEAKILIRDLTSK